MIFSELYSAYYNAVARIIEAAFEPGATERDLQQRVLENAFSESVLTILPALKSGRWPLLKKDLTPALQRIPTMPLTMLEKQWLKAICEDPRVRLFGVELPELRDVEPLFTREHYRIYDQYADGDPFEDEEYIRHFRMILDAIRTHRPLQVSMLNRWSREARMRLFPVGLEYSAKDDKIRVLTEGCWFRQFNLSRIISCEYYKGDGPWNIQPPPQHRVEMTLMITDERNTMERAMLHFAHFEKQAEKLEEGQYRLRLKYEEADETELVIRILSFGPYVRVTDPPQLVKEIRKRLMAQQNSGMQ